MGDSVTRTTRRLVLEPHPSSASAARRWVREQLHAVGHDELADSAELATSELVTNAVLHAQTAVTVTMEPRAGRWRIRIGDVGPGVVALSSQQAGQVRSRGRGLQILDSISRRWGVEEQVHGKHVWFEPRSLHDRVRAPSPSSADGSCDLPEGPEARVAVLHQAPIGLLRQARQRVADLHRELVLLTYAHEAETDRSPARVGRARSSRLVELADAIEPITELGSDDALGTSSAETATLTCRFPSPAPPDLGSWPDLLDEADDYCRGEDLLTLAAPRQEALARRWFLTEVARQFSGLPPRSWPDYVDTH